MHHGIHTQARTRTEAQKGGREERQRNVSGKSGGVIIPISEWICEDKGHSLKRNV